VTDLVLMSRAAEYTAKADAMRREAEALRARGFEDEAKDFQWMSNGWRELAARAEREGR
jgi:hypothetical protein